MRYAPRFLAATFVAVALYVGAGSLAGAAPPVVPASPSSNHAGCAPVTSTHFGQFAAAVWDQQRWRRGDPPRRTILAKHRLLGCAVKPGLARQVWHSRKSGYLRYRAFREVAPYPGGGTYWAIPYYIVACESEGSWSAYNSSGAAGPYQIMAEWGRPYPAVTWQQKMENHRIAARIYAGGAGASNWTCA